MHTGIPNAFKSCPKILQYHFIVIGMPKCIHVFQMHSVHAKISMLVCQFISLIFNTFSSFKMVLESNLNLYNYAKFELIQSMTFSDTNMPILSTGIDKSLH